MSSSSILTVSVLYARFYLTFYFHISHLSCSGEANEKQKNIRVATVRKGENSMEGYRTFCRHNQALMNNLFQVQVTGDATADSIDNSKANQQQLL